MKNINGILLRSVQVHSNGLREYDGMCSVVSSGLSEFDIVNNSLVRILADLVHNLYGWTISISSLLGHFLRCPDHAKHPLETPHRAYGESSHEARAHHNQGREESVGDHEIDVFWIGSLRWSLVGR